jgi:hypothetical protein
MVEKMVEKMELIMVQYETAKLLYHVQLNKIIWIVLVLVEKMREKGV